MQNTVDHDPKQFVVERHLEFQGVLAYAVDADKQVALDLGWGRVGEGNNIGQRVVLQVLDIDGMQVVIGAKDKVELQEDMLFLFNDRFDPGSYFFRPFQIELDLLGMEIDPNLLFGGIGSRYYLIGKGEEEFPGEGDQILKSISTVLPLLVNLKRSHRVRIKKTPRPPHLSRLSGWVGSGRFR